MNITEAQVTKILTTIDAGLVSGLGQPIPGQMCVEAAICYALGLPHGDDPLCVDPALRLLKITLNDGPWPSAQARAEGLRKLAVLQLGSLGALDSAEFAKRVAMFTVTKLLPRVLRRQNLVAEAEACEKAENLSEAASTAEAARAAAEAAAWAAEAAAKVAEAAAWAAEAAAKVAEAATWTAEATAKATTWTAGAAAKAAARAARAAAWAAEATTKAAARAASAASATELTFLAEGTADILIEMKVPGVQWLNLL